MKKAFALLLCVLAVAAFCPALGACTPRAQILKVYNWEDYIDPDLIGEFEEWYEETTGSPIRVKYTTFSDNEEMLPKIREAHINYDVICPSDYMVYRLKNMGLVLPLDLEKVEAAMQEPELLALDDDEDGEPDENPFFEEGRTASLSDINAVTFTETDRSEVYSVGYMTGTVGILYNNEHIRPAEVGTWASLFDRDATQEDCRLKIYMKDSVRETVSIAALYENRAALRALFEAGDTEAQQALVRRVINFRDENDGYSTIDSLLARYRRILLDQKNYIRGYENDLGKNEFVSGSDSVYLGVAWSGDAMWCMFDTDDDGNIVGLNTQISYAVPDEGSNIWFDAWCIPSYAVNVDAANYFIGYMARATSAYRNMDFIGYTSANEITKEAYRAYLDADEDVLEDGMLFDTNGDGTIDADEQAYKDMLLDAMFPSEATAARCATYDDFGDKITHKLDDFWATLK